MANIANKICIGYTDVNAEDAQSQRGPSQSLFPAFQPLLWPCALPTAHSAPREGYQICSCLPLDNTALSNTWT